MLLSPLLLLPGVASEATVQGRFTASSVTVEGAASVVASSAIAYGPSDDVTPSMLAGHFSARAVDVYWTRKEFAAAGTAPSGAPLVALAKGPPATGHDRFEAVVGDVASWNPDANWMIVTDSHAPTFWNATHVEVRVASNATWRAGNPAEAREQLGDGPALVHEEFVREGTPFARLTAGAPGHVEGELWLYLWSTNMTLRDEKGRTAAFASGYWTQNETGGSGGTREEHAQLLALHLEGARVDVATLGRVLVAEDELGLQGGMEARLADANGGLEGLKQPGLKGQLLELEGDLHLSIQGVPDEARLDVQAEGTVEQAAVDGVELHLAAPVARSGPPTTLVAMLSLIVAVLALFGGLWSRARMRAPDALTRAEHDLLRHRPDRARRRLKPVLERRPDDVPAWFLLGASWLQEDAAERLIHEIEPVARRLAGRDVSSLAFLLALAHARLRRAEDVLTWLRRAVRDPDFRARAAREPGFAFLGEDERFRRLVDGSTAAYG